MQGIVNAITQKSTTGFSFCTKHCYEETSLKKPKNLRKSPSHVLLTCDFKNAVYSNKHKSIQYCYDQNVEFILIVFLQNRIEKQQRNEQNKETKDVTVTYYSYANIQKIETKIKKL